MKILPFDPKQNESNQKELPNISNKYENIIKNNAKIPIIISSLKAKLILKLF